MPYSKGLAKPSHSLLSKVPSTITPTCFIPMQKKPYIPKGRTGREGTSLKSWGALVAAAGLIWTLSGVVMDQAASVYVASVATLLVGALVLRVGFVRAKSYKIGAA